MISAFKGVVNAGLPGMSATTVAADVQKLEGAFASQLRSGVQQNSVGQAMWSDAMQLCTVGHQDGHSAGLFQQGYDLLSHTVMPKLQDDGTWHVNAPELFNGRISSMLVEALAAACESSAQWSKAGMDEAAPKFIFMFEKVDQLSRLMNACEWKQLLDLVALFEALPTDQDGAPTIEPIELEQNLANEDEFTQKQAIQTLVTMSEAARDSISRHDFKRTPFVSILSRIDDMKGEIDKIALSAPSTVTSCSVMLKRVSAFVSDMQCREAIRTELDSLCKLLRNPVSMTPVDMVAQVQNEGMAASCVGIACAMMQQRKVRSCDGGMDYKILLADYAQAGLQHRQAVSFHTDDVKAMVERQRIGNPYAIKMTSMIVDGSFERVRQLWLRHTESCQRLAWNEACSAQAPKDALITALGKETFDTLSSEMGAATLRTGTADATQSLQVSTLTEVLVAFVDVVPWSLLKDVAWPECVGGEVLDTVGHIWVIRLMCCCSQALALTAWLADRCCAESPQLTVGDADDNTGVIRHNVDPVVVEGVVRMKDMLTVVACDEHTATGNSTLTDALGVFPNPQVEASCCLDIKLEMTSLLRTWLPSMMLHLGKALAAKLSVISNATAGITPSWQYFIGDYKYNKQLAKRTLLDGESRTKLANHRDAHHHFVTSMAAAFSRWTLEDPDKYSATAKQYQESAVVLEHAKDTVHVMVAVSIVEEVPKERKAGKAAAFAMFKLGDNFPAALKKAVMALKAKQQ